MKFGQLIEYNMRNIIRPKTSRKFRLGDQIQESKCVNYKEKGKT